MRLSITFIGIIILILNSCTDKRENRRQIVSRYCGTSLTIPDVIPARVGEDSFNYNFNNADYKIVTYIDTAGCTPCRMKIPSWNEILNDWETIPDVDVSFLMIINSDSKVGAEYAVNLGAFPHPVWFDQDNSFSSLNKLPVHDEYHTFLLNADNTILAIGNPVDNPKIRSLYRNLITGETSSYGKDENLLHLCSKPVKALGIIAPGDSVRHNFLLRNSRHQILTVQDIITSCNCTVAHADKDTLRLNDRMEIEVTFKADSINRHFTQNVDIYFNETEEPQRLIVYGIINNLINN